MQRRDTGREKALMEVGGKLNVEEEQEERSGLESGLMKKEYENGSEGKKSIDTAGKGVCKKDKEMIVETARSAEIVL